MNKKTYSLFFFFFFSSSRATSARGPRDEKKEREKETFAKDVFFKCEETSFFCLEKKKK